MTFEGEQFLGWEGIYGKLSSFGKLSHQITTCDVQPTANEGVIAVVSGQLSIDDGPPMMFSETFVLLQGGELGYYIHNNIFRLNLAG